MCGSAADAAAAEELLVGRVLTVKRIRELNANQSVMRTSRIGPSGRQSQLAVSQSKCERRFD